MSKRLAELWADEAGVTTVDYAIMLALLAMAAAVVWDKFGATLLASVAGSTEQLAGQGVVEYTHPAAMPSP